ncbi:MAG TPA: hypothetical protein PKH77_19820 [Anaerolineae bacterium]|nr:hypothetical protein [Anaerolineae bacterium]
MADSDNRHTKMLRRVLNLKLQGFSEDEIRRQMGAKHCTWEVVSMSITALKRALGVGNDYQVPPQGRLGR